MMPWRKSSYSASGNCIEVAGWRKSTRSNSQGACVEVGPGVNAVGIRDSKHPGGPVLTFTSRQWQAFTGRLRVAR